MVMTDPIADFLTRIRNANQAKHEVLEVPASNLLFLLRLSRSLYHAITKMLLLHLGFDLYMPIHGSKHGKV